MRSFITRALTIVVATALLSGPAAAQEAGIVVGARAPGALVITLDGDSVDLATLFGEKPVVLEFWATWCPLCRKLEHAMQAARAQYGDSVTFVSVGVSSNQSPERQKAFAAATGMTGLLVFDRDDAAVRAYSVPHTSYVVAVNAQGVVVYTGVGAEQDVDAAVRRALR